MRKVIFKTIASYKTIEDILKDLRKALKESEVPKSKVTFRSASVRGYSESSEGYELSKGDKDVKIRIYKKKTDAKKEIEAIVKCLDKYKIKYELGRYADSIIIPFKANLEQQNEFTKKQLDIIKNNILYKRFKLSTFTKEFKDWTDSLSKEEKQLYKQLVDNNYIEFKTIKLKSNLNKKSTPVLVKQLNPTKLFISKYDY